MKWKTIMIALCGLFCTSFAFASEEVTSAQYITGMASRDNGVQVLYLSETIPDIGCTLTDRIALDPNLKGYKSMFDNIQLARAAHWKAVFVLKGCLDFTLSEQNPDLHNGETAANIVNMMTLSE